MSVASRQYPVGFSQGRNDSPPESEFTAIVSSLFTCSDTGKAPLKKKGGFSQNDWHLVNG